MIAKRLTRLASILSSAMLAVMLLGLSATSASQPGWSMSITRIPSSVSPGAYAAFRVTITNGGKSNISQLYLTDSRPETPFSISPSTGCNSSGQVDCALGALKSGASTTRVIVYKTPTTGPTFDVTFEANTTGVTFSDNHHSHGDTLSGSASTTLDGSGDFAGGYVVDGSPVGTGDSGSQQTTVFPPVNGIGVTVTDGGSGGNCGTGSSPIGQKSTINVDNGHQYGAAFLVTMKIKTSSLSNPEFQLSDFGVCHTYDDGSTVNLPMCAADAPQATACFWPKWGGAFHPDHEEHVGEHDADDWGLLILDVFDFQNGGLRGQNF